MKNILIDLSVLLDYYEYDRREKYSESVKVFDYLKYKDFAFISSSSLDNFEFIKYGDISKVRKDLNRRQKLEIVHNFLKEIISFFKIAKTPSYIEIDFDDIEDSQIIASAKAIDALVLTRDEKLLQKYPDITISPKKFLSQITNHKSQITNIDFANLKYQHTLYQSEIEKAVDKVYNHGRFIMGSEINELENKLCEFTGAKNAVTCSSGTDALLLAMMALDVKEGDEIITTPFTFIATAETIALLGAKPVFVDIGEETYNIDVTKIEKAITPKTKAIISVSLFGQPSDLDQINQYTNNKYTNQPIYHIIDGAQSFGATYKEKAEVHFCDIYATSFFPAKPLGCFGDGGAVLTNNDELAEKIKILRVHGQNKRYQHKYIGLNARMDTFQAAVLNVKFKHYKKDLKLRQQVAEKYNKLLVTVGSDRGKENAVTNHCKLSLVLPKVKSDRTSAWAQYSIRVKNRDELQKQLKEVGIPTAVHYPMPLHMQKCFKYLGYKKGDFPVAERVSQEILSLPMNPYLTEEEINYIVDRVKMVVSSN